MVAIDETGEILLQLWDDMAMHFDEVFEEGKCYYLSNIEVRLSAKGAVRNKCLIVVPTNGKVEPLSDESKEAQAIPLTYLDVRRLDHLSITNKGDQVDSCGIVAEIKDNMRISTRNGETWKRSIWVSDESEIKMEVTLWGQLAQKDLTFKLGDIIVLHRFQIHDYNGINLTSTPYSEILPGDKFVSLERVKQLGDYLALNNPGGEPNLVSKVNLPSFHLYVKPYSTLEEVEKHSKSELEAPSMTRSNRKLFYCSSGYIKEIHGRCTYRSCPDDSCMKGIPPEVPDGQEWKCTKCGRSNSTFVHRYLGEVLLCDSTNSLPCTLSQSAALSLFGISANEFYEKYEQNFNFPDKFILQRLLPLSIAAFRKTQNGMTMNISYQIQEIFAPQLIGMENQNLLNLLA
jgi:hypothetical protein